MSEAYRMIALVLLAGYLLFCAWVGYKKKSEIKNTSDFFLAGKNVGFFFLFFTCFASISGAGNFIGQAGKGASTGMAAYWWWFGEVLLGIVRLPSL
jgi:Na+/proline symporter